MDMGVLLMVFAGGFKVGKLVISSVGDEVIVHNVLVLPSTYEYHADINI